MESLAHLHRGETAVVTGLDRSNLPGTTSEEADILVARLRDLGFVAGAHCEVLARMWPGGDPLVVRIGGSSFALRRVEAAAVTVQRAVAGATRRHRAEVPGASAAIA